MTADEKWSVSENLHDNYAPRRHTPCKLDILECNDKLVGRGDKQSLNKYLNTSRVDGSQCGFPFSNPIRGYTIYTYTHVPIISRPCGTCNYTTDEVGGNNKM